MASQFFVTHSVMLAPASTHEFLRLNDAKALSLDQQAAAQTGATNWLAAHKLLFTTPPPQSAKASVWP
jgi:hypothetical protein